MHKDRDDGNKQLQQRNHETDTSFREEFRGDEQVAAGSQIAKRHRVFSQFKGVAQRAGTPPSV
jgi:hypothetical protein